MLLWFLSGVAVTLPLLLFALVAQRRRSGNQLTEGEDRLRVMLELTADWYWEQDADFRFTEMAGSTNGGKLAGGSDHLGKQRWDMPYVNVDEATWEHHRAQLLRHETFHDFELVRENATGQRFYYLTSGVAKFDANGKFTGYRGTGRDVTLRRRAEEQVKQLAHFDTLTQLPNRTLFMDRLQHEIQRAQRGAFKTAVLLLDLDRFKEINDSLGHEQGDELLIQTATRLRACVRETDTIARLGGDEFAVILNELESMDAAQTIASKILQSIHQPFELKGGRGHTSASIGIAMCPEDAAHADGLLKAADQAMYAAKEAGRNRFNFFTNTLQDLAQKRTWLTQAMHEAIAGNQFWVVYQPIVEMKTGRTLKAEALIRWCHPERGLISPAEFIPVAESSGLINAIGDWVFENALAQVRRCRALHDPDFQISVNKSPVQFHSSNDANPRWPDKMLAYGLPGNCVVAEITEGLLLDTNDDVAKQLRAFCDAGIQVALDDFGTGFSSLSYLQKHDIDFIKIDQSFVKNLTATSKDLALCEAIVVMAHKLGIKVIAEGVETEEQKRLLQRAGCDFGQGYLFSRPMPPQEFEEWLMQERRRAGSIGLTTSFEPVRSAAPLMP